MVYLVCTRFNVESSMQYYAMSTSVFYVLLHVAGGEAWIHFLCMYACAHRTGLAPYRCYSTELNVVAG